MYHVSNWYFKTCRKKARKTLQNPKRAKIIAKVLKIRFLQKTELMSRSIKWAIYIPNLKNLPWFIRPRLQKLSLTYFGCKLGQSDPIVMKLKLDMSCHLLNAYSKFQIDISKHVEKSLENTDGWKEGRTDGRTLPRHNTSVFQTGCKKGNIVSVCTVRYATNTACYSYNINKML